MPDALVILCTCPDQDTATRLAAGLLERRLAACVNVLPGIRSMYRWQGAVNEDAEVLMVVKTMQDRYPALEAWLLEAHPYEVPEIVALAARDVAPAYLAWIGENTEAENDAA